MNIELKLDKIALPRVFIREGRECFLDPYRKRLIEVTPEEAVRQRFARYLETKLNVPRAMLEIEVPMSHYDPTARGRADIVISDIVNGDKTPLAVVECKREDIYLTDSTTAQARRYCETTGARYIMLCNGITTRVGRISRGELRWLSSLPTYDDMRLSKGTTIPDEKRYARMKYRELTNMNRLTLFNQTNTHWVFGADTPPEYRPFAVNLYECLRDTSHKLPPVKTSFFEVLEDMGTRYMDYTNAGGGHYLGYYRAFLVRDWENSAQVISLSLFGTDAGFRNEHRSSYCSLVVAIDKLKVSHNILQYNVDRFARLDEGVLLLTHGGQIRSLPSKPLIESISAIDSGLIDGGGNVNLGVLPYGKLYYLDDAQIAETIYRIIEYGLFRQRYRAGSTPKIVKVI